MYCIMSFLDSPNIKPEPTIKEELYAIKLNPEYFHNSNTATSGQF